MRMANMAVNINMGLKFSLTVIQSCSLDSECMVVDFVLN